jgi:hypothetical protein
MPNGWNISPTVLIAAVAALHVIVIASVLAIVRFRWYGQAILLLTFIGAAGAMGLGVGKLLGRNPLDAMPGATLIGIALVVFLALGSVLYLGGARREAPRQPRKWAHPPPTLEPMGEQGAEQRRTERDCRT